MTLLPRRVASALLMLAIACTGERAGAFEHDVARALAEAHFEHLYAFDMLAAYESRSEHITATFVVARRWQPERPELLLHFVSLESGDPARNRAWSAPVGKVFAGLLVHNLGRSDDLMVYTPWSRRVRRLPAPELQKQPMFEVLPLGEFRPIVRGELRYRALASREPGIRIVEGRTRYRGQPFDRVRLHFATGAPLAVRTVFFQGDETLRTVHIDPGEVREIHGRLVPYRQRIELPSGAVTRLRLRNLVVDPILPEEIFTEHNLWVQRFPRF